MATKRERECAKEPLTEKTDEREKRTGQPGKKNHSQALANILLYNDVNATRAVIGRGP